MRPSATVTLDLGPPPPLEPPAANHADTEAKHDRRPQIHSNNTGDASTPPTSGNRQQQQQRTRSLGGAAAPAGPSLGRAYSFEEAATAKQQGDAAGSELNLERFPPSFRTGAAADELTAVWREFILAEARVQQRCEQSGGSSSSSTGRRRRVALTIDHLSQHLAHISSERLSLLLEVLQSRRFLISRRGEGTQILWERAWVWEK